jgi:transposase InsO family protein
MPWKETCQLEQRLKFIARYLEGDLPMTELCEEFGVSRDVGYKWVRRYQEFGVDGLKERSRAPQSHPNATGAGVVELIVAARCAHPNWGPRKLLAWLGERHRQTQFPAASTVGEILTRHGLVTPRKRCRRARPEIGPLRVQEQPNDCWATDFKGEFRMRDRRYCYPLTIQDSFSRYLLTCQGLTQPVIAQAKPVFEATFREHGLPQAMRSDNGAPFAVASFSGLTRLSAWWVKLGIRLERIQPGHPEQNGRLERLHRTLKQETTKPPGANLRGQQVQFECFRREYNEQRPHEAIDNKTPSSLFTHSQRPYPERFPAPEYDGALVRRADPSGAIWIKGWRIHVSKAVAREEIALEEFDDGLWYVRFYAMRLGVFDERRGLLSNGTGVVRHFQKRS